MPSPNGTGAHPASEAYDHLSARIAEDRLSEEDAGAGWVTGGIDRDYPGEWSFNLEIPDCPDTIPANFGIDAKLVVGQRHKQTGRMRASTLKRVSVNSIEDLNKMRERFTGKADGAAASYSELNRMREASFGDPFAVGADQQFGGGGGGALASYVPLWPGPVTRQLYWQDYFAMSAKAFEAYNHDPVSWRCVHMKQEFALGKGLQATVTYSAGSQAGQRHEAGQIAWDEFWKRNKMDARLDMMARDLSWGGEQFLRYFTKGKLTTVRSLDPASIYDIITDPEDLETVFAYHQQFQTAYQMYPPNAATPPTGVQAPEGPTQIGASTRFIIRQILPQEVDHYRINQSAYERRGRSDLYPALGWIRRLRDYLISHVIRADMLSRFAWDLSVKGNRAAVAAVRQAMFPNGQAPPPGSVFGHNEQSTLTAVSPDSGGSSGGRFDPVLDALVTMVSNSIGLPKDWLGFGMNATRASALVATEPAARSLEELQGTMEQVLHDQFDRVMATAGINDADIEFTFPSIASEDRTQKLQDLSYSEANGWIAKSTAATIAAKELGITGYDFEEEQKLIAAEFTHAEDSDEETDESGLLGPDGLPVKTTVPKQGDSVIRRPMIVASNRQAPKLDPTKAVTSSEDEPPGLLVPLGSGTDAPVTTAAVPGNPASVQPPAPGSAPSRNGFPGDENPLSTAGAANIRSDNAVKEGETRMYTATEVREMLVTAMEESRDTRAFVRAAAGYRQRTAENLAELAGAVAGASESGNRG